MSRNKKVLSSRGLLVVSSQEPLKISSSCGGGGSAYASPASISPRSGEGLHVSLSAVAAAAQARTAGGSVRPARVSHGPLALQEQQGLGSAGASCKASEANLKLAGSSPSSRLLVTSGGDSSSGAIANAFDIPLSDRDQEVGRCPGADAVEMTNPLTGAQLVAQRPVGTRRSHTPVRSSSASSALASHSDASGR